MTITYHFTYEDYEAFVVHYGKRAQKGNSLYWIARLLLSAIAGGFALREFIQPNANAQSVVILLALALFVYLVFPLIYGFALKQGAKRINRTVHGKELFTKRTLTIAADGLVIELDGKAGLMDWENLLYWEETDDHFFIYMDPNSAHIIPKSALADEQAQEELKTLLGEYLAEVE